MSYVDAYYDRKRDKIFVAERVDGQRLLKEDRVEHVLYYQHAGGTHQSIFGDSCKRFSVYDSKKFSRKKFELQRDGTKIFESDIRPEFRYLADRYKGIDAPALNLCFFDIEADFDPNKGFAPVEDPFNAVTAITLWLSSVQTIFTLALCPPTLTRDEAQDMCDPKYENGVLVSGFENTVVFDDENEMLMTFLDMIEDADVLSGWNSEGYDIPYLVNRIKRNINDNEAARLCLWNQRPRKREYMKFGKLYATYDLVGRVHLDYLLLYKKHNTQQQHSYRLDFIGEIEVGENKVPYEGTLDQLYKQDFEKFVAYNRQDVALLVKIDEKRKFIELANQIAHANYVLLKTTVGSVALVEQAIINEMHNLGFIVPDRRVDLRDDPEDDEDEEGRTPVVGAYVASPKAGLRREIGCIDINSLYPSAIRALNMSPETIIAQVRSDETMALVAKRIAEGVPRAEAWDGLFCTLEVQHMIDEDDYLLTIDFEDGRAKQMTGAQLYEYIFNPANSVCITANGTIFRTDKEGIIPQLLAQWYAERKQMQGLAKMFIELQKGVEVDDELAGLLAA